MRTILALAVLIGYVYFVYEPEIITLDDFAALLWIGLVAIVIAIGR